MGGASTIVAEFDVQAPVPRYEKHSKAEPLRWGDVQLVEGRVRRELLPRNLWEDEDVNPDTNERHMTVEQLKRVSDALRGLKLTVAPFENGVLGVCDGWSDDVRIEAGDVRIEVHWFLYPPPHFEGIAELCAAIE
jgi:hypothetical protein